jgi:DNA-binding transcriptional regulator LsrR (DeoR family)
MPKKQRKISSGAKNAKKRRPIQSQEKAEIAVERFAGYRKEGKPTSITALATKYDRAPAVIVRSIKSALQDGLVEIRRTAGAGSPALHEGLAEKLKSAFPNLRRVLVVQPIPRRPASKDPIDDPLNIDLGKAIAKMLAQTEMIDDEAWAIGSGRACWRSLAALRDLDPKLRAKTHLVSLTGNFFNRPDTTMGFWLSADHNAALFASCFDDSVRPYVRQELIMAPLVYAEAAAMENARKTTALADDCWKELHVKKGLIGVGESLTPGHKFFDSSSGDLKPVHADMTILRNVCDKLVSRFSSQWVPVCDTSNRLIWVPAPKDLPEPDPEIVKEIRPLLKSINSKLLSVTNKQLKSVPTLILVAGSVQKAPAIYEWIQRYKVRYLCTDIDAAQRLLKIAELGTYRTDEDDSD